MIKERSHISMPTQDETNEQAWTSGSHEELQQRIRLLLKQSRQLRKEMEQDRTYKQTIHEILTNKDMSYADRVLWTITLENYTDELLTLKAFQPNIAHLLEESGASDDTATKFFSAMCEARGIQYSNKSQQEEQKWSSVSTVVPLANHTKANTKAASKRIKQREKVAKRRQTKLVIQACESCGSTDPDHAYAAIVPYCVSCNHPTMSQQIMAPAKDVRIIVVEEPTAKTPPSQEFSDEDEDDDLDLEETTPPSQEFSEKGDDEETDTEEATTPSQEFSDTLVTPDGSTLEICNECGDKTCIEWPLDSDGLYISNEEMEDLIAERVKLVATPNNDAPPSQEFSEATSSEEINLEETNTPTQEFSEAPTNNQIETDHPSQEFSEGMVVSTPGGIGTISFIGHVRNRARCRVLLPTLQADNTYYAAYDLTEIEQVTQASLL